MKNKTSKPPKFPLLPFWRNDKTFLSYSNNYTFRWLIFNFRSYPAFGFDFGVHISTGVGIGVHLIIPNWYFDISIPLPDFVEEWIANYRFEYGIMKKLKRKEKKHGANNV